MSLFDSIPAPGDTAASYGQSNGMTLADLQTQRSQYVEERGTTMDIIHDLYQGTSQALKLIGEGTGWQGMEDLGASMESTELYKPDASQYYGTQGRLGRVVDMIAQNAPLTLGIVGVTATGSLAGPAGAVAAFTGAMGAVGKGTFDQSVEELRATRPEATEDEVFQYGLINAVSEVGSEGLGMLIPFGLGKMVGKTASKNVLKTLIDSGRVTPSEAVSSIVKTIGGREATAALFGGAAADGASEVVNELVQAANRESVGLEKNPVDFIDLFLAGSAPGGAIAAGTLMSSARAKGIVKGKLEEGLQSTDEITRATTVETMGEAMDNIDPELGVAFREKMEPLIKGGPINLDEALEDQNTRDQIINEPEKIIEEKLQTVHSKLRTEKRDVSGITGEPIVDPKVVPVTNPAPKPPTSIQEGIAKEIAQRESLETERQSRPATALQDAEATKVQNFMNTTEASLDMPLSMEDYNRAMEDEALKSSILMGMDQVEADTNELKNPELTLVERRQLKDSIKKTKNLIQEEVAEAKGPVEEKKDNANRKVKEVKGTPEVQDTTGGETLGIPEEVTQVVKPKVKPKVQPTRINEDTPTRPTTERTEATSTETPVVPKVKPEANPEVYVDPEIAEDVPLSKEQSEVAMALIDKDIPAEEAMVIAKENTPEQTKVAIAWVDKGVSLDDSLVLAKRGVPASDVPVAVEEIRDEPTGSSKTGLVRRVRFTNGDTIERSDTKANDKVYRVTIGTQVYRSSSIPKGTEAIQGKRELELWEDKEPETILTKPRKKLTAKQQKKSSDFLEKQAIAGMKKDGTYKEGAVLTEDKIWKEAFKHITGKMKMVDMEGIFGLALGDVAGKNAKITPGIVRAQMTKLNDATSNTTDVSRKADAGINVATVSADRVFESQEKAAQDNQFDDVEAEDTDVVVPEGNLNDQEELGLEDTYDPEIAEDDRVGRRSTSDISGSTAYVQKNKQRYELKDFWYEPDGKRVAASKKSKDAVRRLETADGRFEVAPAPRKEGEMARVHLLLDGVSAGPTFADPYEAMQFAREYDDRQMEPNFQILANAMLKSYGTPTKAIQQLEGRPWQNDDVIEATKYLKTLVGEQNAKEAKEAARFKDGYELLENVAQSTGEDKASPALAKMLLKNVPKEKLQGLIVRIGKENSHVDGLITIRSNAEVSSQLHEIVHGITVAEMKANPKLNAEVTMLRNEFKAAMVKKKLISNTNAEMLRSLETSEDFVKAKMDFGISKAMHDVAYATLNNNEFLAQAFGNRHVQAQMKDIAGYKRKSLWDNIKSFVGKALGLTGDKITMLEEVLTLGTEISKQDLKRMDKDLQMEATFNPFDMKTDDMVRAILKEKEENWLKDKTFGQLRNIKNLAEFIARPVSDMILSYSPKLHGLLMNFETDLMLNQKRYTDQAQPFLNWYKGLSKSQKVRYDLALMNSQKSENRKIIEEIPKKAYESMQGILEDLNERRKNVGLSGTDKDFYFPRRVKDVVGLTNHLMKNEEWKGELGDAYAKEAARLGQTQLNENQRAQVVTDMMQAGHFRQLPRPGADKKRTVPMVTPEVYKFYSNSSEALIGHIFEMNEKIGQREFIGGSTRKKDIQRLEKRFRDIEKMEAGPERDTAILEYTKEADALEDLETDLLNRLGAVIGDEMGTSSMEDQVKVRELISSRLRQKGAHGAMDAIRNVGYATTMGNFLSAITQLGDIPIIFYSYGLNRDSIGAVGTAFKNVAKIVRREMGADVGPVDALVDSADFTNILREFTTASTSANLVEKLFKYSGLKYTDLIGKEAYMQAARAKWSKDKNKEAFVEKYKYFFGDKTADVHKDLKSNKKTDDVMTVLIAELSEFQPVSLSQQSQGYLGGGNLRMAYMLKTFTLRATSAALREGATEMKKGNYAMGVTKIASILLIYSMAGAGADELKDLLRGKSSSITDNTFDNMLQMLFMSKYTLVKGAQSDSVIKSLMANLLPPVRYADNFIADVYGLASDEKEFKAKSLTSVPLIGTIAYSQSTAGQDTYSRMEKEDILEKVKSNKKDKKGPYAGDLSKRIREYNKGVSSDKRISNDTVMRAYKN